MTVVTEEETVYTTYCPITTPSSAPTDALSTSTDIQTTLITVTSCEGDKCAEKAVTTGVNYITNGKEVQTSFSPLPTGSSSGGDKSNSVELSKAENNIEGDDSPKEGLPSNEKVSSSESFNNSQTAAPEEVGHLVAADSTSKTAPSGSQANDTVNNSQTATPEEVSQLVASVSASKPAPSGSQAALIINTYEGSAASHKPWTLPVAALAAIALL